ncbi:hypothetical protein LNP74_28040 [Klebsiella pneumoniae subsp. pneumoniae]|nr:hypothetical protein [Klebsiella pneumoniae subsp. pneumoniae]
MWMFPRPVTASFPSISDTRGPQTAVQTTISAAARAPGSRHLDGVAPTWLQPGDHSGAMLAGHGRQTTLKPTTAEQVERPA